MYSGSSPERLAVPERGSSERSAFCQTGSLAPLSDGRFTVSGSIWPFPFLTITKTPSRVSSSTSSCSRESAELMVLAAFMALFLAVSSTFESRASLSNRKSAKDQEYGPYRQGDEKSQAPPDRQVLKPPSR